MPSPVALRASLRPSVIVLALVAMSAAGCSSDTSRFEGPFANPFASKQADVTGTVTSAPAASRAIESQPLPAPVQTAGTLPPPSRPAASHDATGATAITIGQGDTLETLSKRHGVPVSAIMQANAITAPTALYPGQRLVIPRNHAAAPAPAARAPASSGSATHTVAAGDTLIGISKRYNVPVKDLAKANNIEPQTQVRLGQNLTIPGRAPAAKPTAIAAAKPVPTPTPVAQAAAKPATAP